MNITEERFSAVITQAVSQALAERRSEDFNPPRHTCLLSEDEKAAIKDLAEIFKNVKDIKWKVLSYVILSLAIIVFGAVGVSLRTWFKGIISQ